MILWHYTTVGSRHKRAFRRQVHGLAWSESISTWVLEMDPDWPFSLGPFMTLVTCFNFVFLWEQLGLWHLAMASPLLLLLHVVIRALLVGDFGWTDHHQGGWGISGKPIDWPYWLFKVFDMAHLWVNTYGWSLLLSRQDGRCAGFYWLFHMCRYEWWMHAVTAVATQWICPAMMNIWLTNDDNGRNVWLHGYSHQPTSSMCPIPSAPSCWFEATLWLTCGLVELGDAQPIISE